jgi:hypothetical protein
MGDWLLNLPLPWMALLVFLAIYLATAAIYFVVTRLAVDARGRAFKAVSPGMLPPLGIIFGLLVGFVAVQVWNDFDRPRSPSRRKRAPFAASFSSPRASRKTRGKSCAKSSIAISMKR